MGKVRKEQQYSLTAMKKALTAVQNGTSIRQSAKRYNIPFTTLRSRCRGIYSLVMKKGPSTVLNPEEENNLVNWILYLGSNGFPQTKNSVLDSVQLICNKLNKKTPFINNRPSKHWYHCFMKRHKESLSLLTGQNLTKRRVAVDKQSIKLWFYEVGAFLNSKNLLHIEPTRIFNVDDRCFFLNPKSEKVIVKKVQKSVCNLFNDDKEFLTALVTCNAKGQMPPGLIMFKGAKLPANKANFLPSSFAAGKSENGGMTAESFYDYIVNIFYPWCVEKDIVFPIILYVDGHSSRLTLPLTEFCAKKHIELIALYPNATQFMQPLDVALFKPLKKAYKSAVMEWGEEHNGASLNKENFGNVLAKALNLLDLEVILSKGFEATGLHPFNSDAIDYSKMLGSGVEDYTLEYNRQLMIDNSDEKKDSIQYIEKYIGNECIGRFKKAAEFGVWIGPENEKGLYEFWQKSCFTFL